MIFNYRVIISNPSILPKCLALNVANFNPLEIAQAAINKSGVSICLLIFFNCLSISIAFLLAKESKGIEITFLKN